MKADNTVKTEHHVQQASFLFYEVLNNKLKVMINFNFSHFLSSLAYHYFLHEERFCCHVCCRTSNVCTVCI